MVINIEVKEVLDIAILSGEILLISGSEIYRVEDTINRICSAYNIKCECFVTPTGIFISGWSKNNPKNSVSLIKRIKSRTINLHSIEAINTFSRSLQIKKVPYDEAMKLLRDMKRAPYFPFYRRLIAAGVTSFAYGMLFGNTAINGLIASFISIVIYAFRDKMSRISLSPFFLDFIWSFIAGFLAIIADKFVVPIDVDSVIIGSIIVLFPGLAITNGIRDALYGDILSSQARLTEALFTVTAIGVGVGISLLLMKYWM